MNKRKWTDNQFIEAIKNSLSYAQVLRLLKLKPAGGNYNTVKRKIKELNIDISHMTGAAWNVGSRFRIVKSAQPLNKILVKHSTFSSTYKLKNRLLKENIKKYKCEHCKLQKWCNKPIPLELHHINGIKDDLRIENLQILCPNCHALTNNYRGKNKKCNNVKYSL